ncbi:MAG: hypothetical protein H6R45_1020 [Proteobacteria bacterium]|nr:hypothetical protein [Pseudomonadota bacterium]
MDTLRGNFAERAPDELGGYDAAEDDGAREDPPVDIGTDERRMQVRAYNHWASQLDNRNFPSIDELEPANLPDFGPYSVLLDFSHGIDNPGIAYLGEELAKECDAHGEGISALSDVPPRSLLSRITDHYMQILANQAPIGFEAEFVNQRGSTILYRGILLPYSSDDDAIDFIYGVINWKEMADQQTADALLLEIDQALDDDAPEALSPRHDDVPLTDWADGPAADLAESDEDEEDDVLDLAEVAIEADAEDGIEDEADIDDEAEDGDGEEEGGLPRPRFGSLLSIGNHEPRTEPVVELGGGEAASDPAYAAANEPEAFAPVATEPEEIEPDATGPDEMGPDEMGLGDWLAAAREVADEVRHGEERTRAALYEAIGRAYDFSLAAARDPEGYAELLADAGIAAQERAPMTPVVKLVFGAGYDKTRLTEYAAALAHGHRHGLACGELGDYLRHADGGLKGVVEAERRLRRPAASKTVAKAPRPALARKLRALEPCGIGALAGEGPEFALALVRRMPDGTVAVIGEVPDDVALVERAAKKLLG